MEFIQQEEQSIKNLFNRFKKKDFSGDTGQAIKNSSYQLAQNLIFKFGSLLFTIIIARMLLPEKMGLYNLALATIVLFASFADLGISNTLIIFGAKLLGKGDFAKAKGYVKKLFMWKLTLIFISTAILLSLSQFIANFYYHKPIFYALLAGGLYLPIVSLVGFIEYVFKTTENFKVPLIKEIFFQIIRFVVVPLAIFYFLKTELSDQVVVIAILAVIFSYLLVLFFLVFKVRKLEFIQKRAAKLNSEEIKGLRKFIIPLSATAFAGMFFGYIDTLMLGHYVSSEFIAYYGVAFSLVGGAAAIIGFLSVSLLPLFAKRKGKALDNIFKKTRDITIFISVIAGIFTYLVARYVVNIAYGTEYLPSADILKAFSILVILIPILGIYISYFTAQGKTKELAYLIMGSAILNILLNFFGITYGLYYYGEIGAVFGAVWATILSRILYLLGLIYLRRK